MLAVWLFCKNILGKYIIINKSLDFNLKKTKLLGSLVFNVIYWGKFLF
jgi:hypothetical protein